MQQNQGSGGAGVEPGLLQNDLREDLRWSVHPAREGGGRLALALVSIPLFGLGAYAASGTPYWAIFAAGVLFLSLSRYFLRTVYTLSPDGLEARYPLRTVKRRWSDFSSFRVERGGVFLSPYPRPSRRENFRGLYLLANQEKGRVAEFVRAHLAGKAP